MRSHLPPPQAAARNLALPQHKVGMVHGAIVNERDICGAGKHFAVQLRQSNTARNTRWIVHFDLISGRAIAEDDGVARPAPGDAGGQA